LGIEYPGSFYPVTSRETKKDNLPNHLDPNVAFYKDVTVYTHQ